MRAASCTISYGSVMLNLFQIALENADFWENAHAALLAAVPGAEATTLSSFADRIVREGRVSINMRPMVLISFFTFGAHENVYRWASVRVEESGRVAEEIIREKLG